MSQEPEKRDWRQMSQAEKVNIGESLAMRAMEENAERLEANRQRINQLFKGRTEWSVGDLQRFINKINSVARRHGCLDKLPMQVFPSREAFLEAAIPVLLEHKVPQEDIDKIFEINAEINKSKQ